MLLFELNMNTRILNSRDVYCQHVFTKQRKHFSNLPTFLTRDLSINYDINAREVSYFECSNMIFIYTK